MRRSYLMLNQASDGWIDVTSLILQNYGTTCISVIRKLLKDTKDAVAYVDDVLRDTSDSSCHMTMIRGVFKRIRCADLTIRPLSDTEVKRLTLIGKNPKKAVR